MSSWILNANFWSIITCLKLTSSSQLSPSFIFSWTTIANISAYFKSIVSYCCSHENETWKPYHWIMRGCTYNTCISIILKLKGHRSGSFQNYSLIYFVKVDWKVYKTFNKSATKKPPQKTCRSTVGQLSADCWPTVGRVSTNCRPTVGRQSADRRPTDFAPWIGLSTFWTTEARSKYKRCGCSVN